MKTVKAVVTVAIALAATIGAQADGWNCQAVDESITVKAFNHTHAEDGVRNAATMIVSDPSISYGRKTIARFTDANETLSNSGARYVAKVDLRFNDSGRQGEDVGPTKLGELKSIVLDVDFVYGDNLADDADTEATLLLKKRNGEVIALDMICARYLKN